MKKVILALALGLMIGTTGTAFANDTVQAVLVKLSFKVNGEFKELKTSPLVVDGTSYLPVRELAGLLGYDVGFEDGGTITLNKKEGVEQVTTAATEDVSMKGRELIELLGKKYPDMANAKSITLSPDGVLRFDGNEYQLPVSSDGTLDISLLLSAGIVSENDF